MQIAPTSPVRPTVDTIQVASWTNPAATAALRSTVDMLTAIEAGMVRDISDVSRIRTYGADLQSTIDVFDTASTAISSDASPENDAFLPLLHAAGGGVAHAQNRVSSKELSTIWEAEQTDILAAIRKSISISRNVADQLDPRLPR